MSKAILVTGGAGFIGSNFLEFFVQAHPEYYVVNLDKLTYAGKLENISSCESMVNYQFVQGDICDQSLVEALFTQYNFHGVIHFAAESHVDNSIINPEIFIQSNVYGTFVLLEVARKHWLDGSGNIKTEYANCRFHHISTDEVYGSLGATGYFTETTPYAPSSPYSASKASSDMLVRSYHRTYGLPISISNCSNNYGPKQYPEKLIPKIITSALTWQPIPIFGDGTDIRDWLYVMDHCQAVDLIFHHGRIGETYNIGNHNEKNNLEILEITLQFLEHKLPSPVGKKYQQLITFTTERPGHDQRYAIDNTKITQELHWHAQTDFLVGMEKTVDWYIQDFQSRKL